MDMNSSKGLAGLAKKQQMLQDPMAQEPDGGEEMLGQEENLDVEIAESIGMKLMQTPEAQQTLQGAVGEGGDPVAKLGVFFARLIDKIQTKMDETQTPLSPRIWLSNGGVLDSWMEDLSEMGVVPMELAPEVKNEVMEVLKLQNQAVGPGGGPSDRQMMEEEQPVEMMGAPQGMGGMV